MIDPKPSRARRGAPAVTLGRAALALALGVTLVAGADALRGDAPLGVRTAAAAPLPAGVPAAGRAADRLDDRVVVDDTLAGRSGKLRARFLSLAKLPTFHYLRRLFGDTTVAAPGVYPVRVADADRPFAFITMRPFQEKVAGRIGRYRIGFWPGERGRARGGRKYDNPEGFIEVTPDNQDTRVSEHFRLADFLTHDQARVWPKYLVLDVTLVDKLELVLADLRRRGYAAERLHVMSGFRTPQYNEGGGETAGRAKLSRHQYGDAADVWVENGAGRMADLNRDGRVDTRDAAILAESADRVERQHPELVGGVGIYRANGAHGPFVHIDTRGARARWGGNG